MSHLAHTRSRLLPHLVRAGLFTVASLTIAMPATAAKVYRCGNVFQDQPCPDVKVADTRPAERPGTPREVADCDAKVRTDCAAKGAQEQRRGSVAELKR